MTIYLGTAVGNPQAVFAALLQIARCDPGLGSYPLNELSIEVTFERKQPGGFCAERLHDIVHSNWEIYISGVDAAWAALGERPLSEAGGGTTANYPFQSNIYVDVGDSFGRHYLVSDKNGKKVYDPLPVILFHELSHAYHFGIAKDWPSDEAAQEIQARVDENAFRAQLGLPQVHPTKYEEDPPYSGTPAYGGLSMPTCQVKSAWSLCKCHIAGAALGSPVAREIVEFRRAKRRFADLELGRTALLEPMWNAYQLFAPEVADDLLADEVLRADMLRYGVLPAVCLLRLVTAHTAAGGDRPTASPLRDYLRAARYPVPGDLRGAADAALGAARMLESGDSMRWWASGPGDVFALIAAAVGNSGADRAGSIWILDGLAMVLRAAAEGVDNVDIGLWLAEVPIPVLAEVTRETLIAQLNTLAARLFRDQADRAAFARRLRDREPEPAHPVRSALAVAGY